MAGDEVVEVSLLSGRSDKPTLTFTPGTPTNPVSVGTEGQWVVTGDEVEPVHVYLVYDGKSVHVARAATHAQALLAGTRLGKEWVAAPVPCELRFGGACLILRYAPRATQPVAEERTMHDGGALWQAAQRAAQGGIGGSQLGAQYPTARPAAGAPPIPMTTLPLHGAPPRVVLEPQQPEEATTIRHPMAGGPQGPLEPDQEVTMIAPQPLLPRSSPPEQPAPPVRTQPATVPPSAERTAATAPGTSNALGYWQSASIPKKATLVLMPFALLASYFIFQPEPPPAPPKSATTNVSAKPATGLRDAGAAASPGETGQATPTVDVESLGKIVAPTTISTAATVPVPTEPPPKLAPLAAGKRTPERQALDAVAAGSFEEASRLYTTLAATHPDDPSYKEAARILREKTGNPR